MKCKCKLLSWFKKKIFGNGYGRHEPRKPEPVKIPENLKRSRPLTLPEPVKGVDSQEIKRIKRKARKEVKKLKAAIISRGRITGHLIRIQRRHEARRRKHLQKLENAL